MWCQYDSALPCLSSPAVCESRSLTFLQCTKLFCILNNDGINLSQKNSKVDSIVIYSYSMQRLVIKLFTPILHFGMVMSTIVLLFFSLVFESIVIWPLLRLTHISFESFVLSTLTFFALLIFWFVNKISTELEKMVQPIASDHLRQSAILYAIILAAFIKTVFFNDYHFGLGMWPVWMIIYLSGLAIIFNAVYLYRRNRVALVIPSPLISPAGFYGGPYSY